MFADSGDSFGGLQAGETSTRGQKREVKVRTCGKVLFQNSVPVKTKEVRLLMETLSLVPCQIYFVEWTTSSNRPQPLNGCNLFGPLNIEARDTVSLATTDFFLLHFVTQQLHVLSLKIHRNKQKNLHNLPNLKVKHLQQHFNNSSAQPTFRLEILSNQINDCKHPGKLSSGFIFFCLKICHFLEQFGQFELILNHQQTSRFIRLAE